MLSPIFIKTIGLITEGWAHRSAEIQLIRSGHAQDSSAKAEEETLSEQQPDLRAQYLLLVL